MTKRQIFAGVSAMLMSAPVLADNNNSASFSNNSIVVSSVLAATIASSHIDFQPPADTSYNGNRIEAEAFKNGMGIMAVNQNSGINAVNQQSVTVKIDQLTLGTQQQ